MDGLGTRGGLVSDMADEGRGMQGKVYAAQGEGRGAGKRGTVGEAKRAAAGGARGAVRG